MTTYDDKRVSEILQGRKAVRAYTLPFVDDMNVGVRLLSEDEIDSCRLEAQRYCKKRHADLESDPDFIERETKRQMVWRSFVDANDQSRKFFASDQNVRDLDSEMVRALFDLYMEHQTWVSPLRHISKEDVKELAEALGKGQGTMASLASCDSDTLRSLCISLASALRST